MTLNILFCPFCINSLDLSLCPFANMKERLSFIIFCSYLPANGEGSDVALKRKDYLRENYGFDCICSACTNSTNEEIRSKVRELQLRLSSSCDSIKSGTGLSLYEMEELVDGLDMIG